MDPCWGVYVISRINGKRPLFILGPIDLNDEDACMRARKQLEDKGWKSNSNEDQGRLIELRTLIPVDVT